MADPLNQTTIQPTDEQVQMANLDRGPASNGQMACSDCDREIPLGEPAFWTKPSYEYPTEGCDPYCAKCCIVAGDSAIAICAALESGELQP